MSNKNNLFKTSRTTLLIVFVLLNFLIASSQTQKITSERDTIRIDKVKPEEFAKNRAKPKVFRKTVVRKSTKSDDKLLTEAQEISKEEEVATLGFTLWKLRKSEKNDVFTERIGGIIGTEKEQDFTPERVEEDPVKVEDGAFVRFSIELPIEGYLYVFDREQYQDGSHSAAYLVYPTKGINNIEDNNQVEANQPIYLPRQKESYCFTLNKGKEGKIVAEVYTFLVTPTPLDLKAIKCLSTGKNSKGELVVECQPREVKKEEFDFEGKLKEWSAHTGISIFNLQDPKYKKYRTMDKAEIASLNNKLNKLTIEAPPPQAIYTVARKPNEPYLVSIPIYITDK